jgi:uncharacterized protein YkwD
LRNAAIALLAVPMLAAIYLGALLHRSILSRLAVALGLTAILAGGVIGAGLPSPPVTTANPPTPIVPLTRAAFRTVVTTNAPVTAAQTIEFTTPMNAKSVASAVTVEPSTPVDLRWDAAGDTLTITPRSTWAPGTFHTISVQAGALAATGQPLARPARAAFLTRQPATASVASTMPIGKRASVNTAFDVRFEGAIDPATVAEAITITPAVEGTLEATGAPKGRHTYRFVPAKALSPDTVYKLSVRGVRDVDGLAVAAQSIAVRTVKAPAVIRFRPRADAKDAARDATVSVRFSEPMDRGSTAKAFSVKIGGKAIKGKISWAENNTVLVFNPASALPYSAAIVAKVDITAKAATGAGMVRSVRAIFRTVAKPKAAPIVRPTSSGSGTRGGAAVGAGSWASVETYYLRLMNCTRQGGWVTSSGACSSPGGRDVAALKLDSGISSRVARPYAKLLATRGACSHFIGGNPGNRLARAGYSSYRWAENIGCRSGNPSSAVLGSHLFFQSEKPYSGGHYVNLMNRAYDRVGIGVWVASGRVRLVVDFYHP